MEKYSQTAGGFQKYNVFMETIFKKKSSIRNC